MQAGRRRETKGRERRHRRRRHCFTRNFLRHSLARSGLNDGKYAQIERGKEGKQQGDATRRPREGKKQVEPQCGKSANTVRGVMLAEGSDDRVGEWGRGRGGGREETRREGRAAENERLIFLPLDWQLAGQKPFARSTARPSAPLRSIH